MEVKKSHWLQTLGKSLERWWYWLVAIGACVSIGLALAIGLAQSVWFDEAYSVVVAKQPLAELLHFTAVDAHPPLYYLILKLWASLFGWSDFALRSLSAACLGLTVVLAMLLARKLFGVRVALWTLPFVALAPFLLRYGFEIRMYMLAALIVVAATYALVRALNSQGRAALLRWGLYALLVAAGVYTQYYTSFVWFAHLLWLTWAVRRRGEPWLKQPWMAAYTGSVLLFLPWLPALLSQLSGAASAGIAEHMMLPQFAAILSFSLFYVASWQLNPWSLLALIGVFSILVLLVRRGWRITEARQGLQLLLCVLLVPIALLTLLSLPPLPPMFVERYVVPFIMVGYLLAGVSIGLVYTQKLLKRWLAGLYALIMLLALGFGVANLAQAGNFNYQRLLKPAAKQIMATIPSCQNRLIIADDPLLYFELQHYNPGNCPVALYSQHPIKNYGGYAPIYQRFMPARHNQLFRQASLVHVYTGNQPLLKIHARYARLDTTVIGNYRIREYQRNAN